MRRELYAHLPTFAQNWACSWEGRRRARARFTAHFRRRLGEWQEGLHGPLDRLHALQRRRLDRLVGRARAHVPYYRSLDLPPPSRAADPREALARTLEAIPPLEKHSYRDDPRAFLAEDVRRTRLRQARTGGTTGTALPLWYTPETLAEEYATVWRLRRSLGVALEDPHLSFGGQLVVPFSQERPPFWRTNRFARQTLFSLHHMSPENLRHYVEAVHAAPARYVQGYPSALHLVARALLEAGRPLPPGRLAAVFPSSESLLAFQRETLEAAFAAPVRDRYGMSEFAASMTGCAEGHLHVDHEFCIVEVEVRERTSRWVRGPLLVTGLAHHATPWLRYRVGDVGTRLEGPCPCGRPGEVFLDVDGRIEDYVVTPDGRRVGRLDHVFKEQRDVAEAQILQEGPGAIEVRVVARPSWSPGSEHALRSELRARLGPALAVEVRLVERIPREPNGKFRAVRSRVGRNAP